jgi:hypothetical protein
MTKCRVTEGHEVSCIGGPCLLIIDYDFILWVCPILFAHASVDGHLGCYDAALNICMKVADMFYFSEADTWERKSAEYYVSV